jgi:hypothetical protein
MNTTSQTRRLGLTCALGLGLLADLLIRVSGRPGLNVTLWALAGTAVLWVLSRSRETPVSLETRWLVGGAVAFAGLLTLRDAEALAVFSLFAAVVLLGLAAGRAALAWAARAHFVDLAASAVRVGALIAMGPFGWNVGAARQPAVPASPNGRIWPQRVRTAARGTVMALPALLVLTALLTSADPMFERVLHAAVFEGFEPLLEHLAFASVIAWFASGYLRAFLVSDGVVMDRVRVPRPSIASSEIVVAVSLLNVLFLVFLAVQVRYLFGGTGLVEVTEGLSYAEYARRGFFELVAAATFVVPVLLIADWAAVEKDERGRRALRATSTLLVLMLVGVLASAAYRMSLYQEAYGLTEDRVYGSAFMIWLTLVLGWLAFTVLRGNRRGFVFGAVIAGVATIAALHVLNPHALIARVNIARATEGAEYDGRYLKTLSADAVPTLIERLPVLPVVERCAAATMLKKRWSGEREGGWRTWNLSDMRARGLVDELAVPAGCAMMVASRTI